MDVALPPTNGLMGLGRFWHHPHCHEYNISGVGLGGHCKCTSTILGQAPPAAVEGATPCIAGDKLVELAIAYRVAVARGSGPTHTGSRLSVSIQATHKLATDKARRLP